MDDHQLASLAPLLERQEGVCLSLYQATHRSHPDNTQDPIRFKNLVKTLANALDSSQQDMLKPFHDLADDFNFWQHTLDGLAIFANADRFTVIPLQRATPDFAVVSDSFHVKPLLRQMQTLDRFQVLCVTRDDARLFEGNRDSLDHIVTSEAFPSSAEHTSGKGRFTATLNLSSYRLGAATGGNAAMFHGHGGRSEAVETQTLNYFKEVDKAVIDEISKPSGLPLILVTLAEYQGEFRKLSKNSQLLDTGISIDPAALKIEDLHKRCWEIIQPIANQRSAEVIGNFQQNLGTGLASDNPNEILPAILDGRVASLLVSADQRIPGHIHRDEKSITVLEDFSAPNAEDILDDMAEMTLRRSGEVLVLPEDIMPTDTGIAAIYRY